jgi:hypothetical protein
MLKEKEKKNSLRGTTKDNRTAYNVIITAHKGRAFILIGSPALASSSAVPERSFFPQGGKRLLSYGEKTPIGIKGNNLNSIGTRRFHTGPIHGLREPSKNEETLKKRAEQARKRRAFHTLPTEQE